jgi:hypothetical protein
MTDHPQEAQGSAGGGKDKDTRNLATRRRQAHREEVLEKLRNAGLIQKVLEDSEKLADESQDIDQTMVARIKAANDMRLKLLNKYLPDVKAVEVQDEDGNVRPAVGFVLVPAKS